MKFKLFRLFLPVILVLSFTSFAQTDEKIHRLEYFFDADPGFGNGIVLDFPAAVTLSNYSFSPDISGLNKGLHTLYTRVQDSAYRWSSTTPKSIYVEDLFTTSIPDIVAAEYFFDTDPGFGNGTAAAVNPSGQVMFLMSPIIASLSKGLHQLYVRVQDANGNWSHTASQIFYKETLVHSSVPNITAAEYFFDTDPGFGNGIPATLTPDTEVMFLMNPIIASLSKGLHQLYVRVKDASGKWSHTQSTLFYKEVLVSNPTPAITTAEYFFDTDPGFGNGIPATLTPDTEVMFLMNPVIASLSKGLHQLYVRVKDASGKWSLTQSTLFYKEVIVNNPTPAITAAEYFFDTDPGFGMATPMTITQADTINQYIDISTAGLTKGLHRLYTRTRDVSGKWSISNAQLLYYETIVPVTPVGDLTVLEWFWNTDPGFGNANQVTLPASNNGQITDFAFEVDVSGIYSNTQQVFYVRVLGDWSLTTIKVIDFTGIALPITLLEFTAQAQQQNVITKWITSQEINSSHFEVEHSIDGISFNKIGSLTAQGNSSSNTNYEFLHPDAVIGLNYYRLKQFDLDGSYKYSPVAKILFNGGQKSIVAYPNPMHDEMNIRLPHHLVGKGLQLTMFDNKGAVVMKKAVQNLNTKIDVSAMAGGSYIISIINNIGEPVMRQVILKK